MNNLLLPRHVLKPSKSLLLGSSSPISRQRRNVGTFQGVADVFLRAHEISGIPWLILVPLSTLMLRSVFTLPLSIWQRKRIVKQQGLRKIIQAIPPVIKLRLAAATHGVAREAPTAGSLPTSSGSAISQDEIGKIPVTRKPQVLTPDQITLLALKETRNRQKKLFAKYNVAMWKNAILPLVQIPLWVSVSMGLRKLTENRLVDSALSPIANTDSLQLANLLSGFSTLDLSLPLDSLPMLAPLALGILSLINVEHNAKMMAMTTISTVGVETAKPNSKISQSLASILNISRLSCIFLMGISTQAPILLSLYWISSQLYSLIQNLFLDWLWPYQR
ncbi:LAFE_0E06854g1_1 [Lachancea fermentati]|uniref:LAFE_0E06854g1_1 n=1 Tax=Lachancea fermentati TaxID=4955 RepID=A0A1G4MD37_LACFM|nr:LAFE_0E06854g1_1 [Lachancea fermentati]